jgi:hypothetical protein
MRLLDLDNDGLGNMDRSLAAAAVAPVPATFTTQASATSIPLGQSITDLATLAGPNGTVSGTVSFFVCGPSLVSPVALPRRRPSRRPWRASTASVPSTAPTCSRSTRPATTRT